MSKTNPLGGKKFFDCFEEVIPESVAGISVIVAKRTLLLANFLVRSQHLLARIANDIDVQALESGPNSEESFVVSLQLPQDNAVSLQTNFCGFAGVTFSGDLNGSMWTEDVLDLHDPVNFAYKQERIQLSQESDITEYSAGYFWAFTCDSLDLLQRLHQNAVKQN